MRKNLFICLFCLLIFRINPEAQQANNWYFPDNVGIGFDLNGVHSLPGGKIATMVPSNVKNRPTEGGATISDSKGNLLFYTDGVTIWNRNHEPMQRGQNLKGGPSATQPASIIPDPGNPSLYYVFTLDDFQHLLKNGLCYSVVNMCLNNGLGDVTDQKNIQLLAEAGEKQAITRHRNDKDYWLVVHKHFTSSFYAYKISPAGISQPVISTIGSYHGGGLFNGAASAIGQMKISPDGSKIGLVNANHPIGDDRALLEVFDFNNETGVISNAVSLTNIIYPIFNGFYGGYGFAFSPNSKNAYVYATVGILQFSFTGTWNYVKTVAPSSSFLNQIGGMQLAPNGKIYIAKGESYLAAITNPDNLVSASGFVLNDVFLEDGVASWSLPGFYDGFRYTAADPPCPSMGSVNGANTECSYDFYPNPFSDRLFLRQIPVEVNDISVYNMVGQLVAVYQPSDQQLFSIETDNLRDEVYLMVVTRKNGLVCVSKLFKNE